MPRSLGTSLLALALGGCSIAPAPTPSPAASPLPASASAVVPPVPASSSAAVPLPVPKRCAEAEDVRVFVGPHAPRAGRPLRVAAYADKPLAGALVLHAPGGAPVRIATEAHGGPPYWWFAEVPAPIFGVYRAVVQRAPAGGGAEEVASCLEIEVHEGPPTERARSWGPAWANVRAWDRSAEDLYSVWIEKLFDAPVGEQLSWPALHEVLRDPRRNLLHDHLDQGEDDGGPGAPPIDPDCADLPYFLRAYFAFKLGLPFGYSSCTRGGGGLGPHCRSFHSNLHPTSQRSTVFATFSDFLRGKVADTVHSGTGRTPAEGNGGDYYPVALSLETIRPGTIYADPYGHILVVTKRIPQTKSSGGVLLAVDGQPDATIARRRFWRGSFLFALEPEMGSPGFKRFRPVVANERGQAHALTNAEIREAKDYGDFSLDQYAAGVEGFYDRMDEVLSPSPLDPSQAMLATILALEEQVKGRVLSVQNAEKYMSGKGKRVEMPKGPAIFETTGAWEDFSTPSRDLRLLIATDVVRGFPARVSRRPERFALPTGKPLPELRAELDALLEKELKTRTFHYERSDGSPFTLSLGDILARATDLEMAYNPNDCVEIRWGALSGSEEASTCKRRASPAQMSSMNRYRPWFHERKRPVRK